jgi:hypothetical protein
MSAALRGPEAEHEDDCPARSFDCACTCGASLQQRILDDFWNSELPSVRRVKRLCAIVDLIPLGAKLPRGVK